MAREWHGYGMSDDLDDLRRQLAELQRRIDATSTEKPAAEPPKVEKPKRRRKYHNGTIRKLPNGRYQLRLRIPNSRPPEYYPHPGGTFTTKAAAEKALDRHNADIDADTWRHPVEIEADRLLAERLEQQRSLTVAEAAEEWLEHQRRRRYKGRELSPGTLVTYRSRVNRVLETWGEARVVDVTEAAVTSWFYELDEAASRGVAAEAVAVLDRIMRYVAETHPELVAASPVNIPADERTVETKRTGRLVSDAAIDALAAAMPPELRAAVLIGGWMGLRVGEVLALDVEAFVEDDVIAVTKNAQTKGGARVGEPKSRAGRRLVPIPKRIAEVVHERRDEAEYWLFPGVMDESRPMPYNTFRGRLVKARDRVRADGVDIPADAGFHDLRHTALTRFGRLGATDADIWSFGGHDDPDAAAQYQHSGVERLRELIARLDG